MTQIKSLIDILESKPFLDKLRWCIRTHHSLYKKTLIKATMFEELFHISLEHASGQNVEWVPGDHGVGKDMMVEDVKVSCKCGTITKKDVWNFSGSRTTSHDGIEDKLVFMNLNHDDIIVSLAQRGKNYEFMVVKSDTIDYGKASDYVDNGKRWIYHDGIDQISCTRSMSDQFWYKIDLAHRGIKPLLVEPIVG